MNWSSERYFELIVMINPEFIERIPAMVEGYKKSIKEHKGTITREENWGNQFLAYQIEKHTKCTYLLFNFKSDSPALITLLQETLDGETPVLRYLLSKTSSEVTGPSPHKLALKNETNKEREKVAA